MHNYYSWLGHSSCTRCDLLNTFNNKQTGLAILLNKWNPLLRSKEEIMNWFHSMNHTLNNNGIEGLYIFHRIIFKYGFCRLFSYMSFECIALFSILLHFHETSLHLSLFLSTSASNRFSSLLICLRKTS